MSKKAKILAAVIAAGLVLVIVSAFILTNLSTVSSPSGETSAPENVPVDATNPAMGNASDGKEYIGAYKTDPVEFDAEKVTEMRNALLDAGYAPINVAHPYEGCELFTVINTPTGMDVPPEGMDAPGEESTPDMEDDHPEEGHTHSWDGFEPYNAYALLCGNGVKMALGDYVFDVGVLNDMRRSDNGERIYPMISQEQADLANKMWSAAEIVRSKGLHPEMENAIILNGRVIPNTGFIIRNDTLYLPIEKIAKTYCALAEVNEGRRTIIQYNEKTYTFFGSRLSEGQRGQFGIEGGMFTVQNPAGIDDDQAEYPPVLERRVY